MELVLMRGWSSSVYLSLADLNLGLCKFGLIDGFRILNSIFSWMINREEINGESWIKDSGVSRGVIFLQNRDQF